MHKSVNGMHKSVFGMQCVGSNINLTILSYLFNVPFFYYVHSYNSDYYVS